ncbi:FAD-dependent monooxygenase [Streptosporangiaceae bacterium NEAU-GS5]|nr:FAD-dependent monooxygenase [Streptosporangiaceae bacterium NEAU-GS5]
MRAVVIGGGVAGSASAIALARIGADVTVYEAYEDPAGAVGSFVSLAVNGLRALDALGCLEPVQKAGFPVERQWMWSGRGKPLGNVARGRRSGDSLLSVTVMRADLVRVLRESAAAHGARIVTGRRLDPDAAELQEADVIVGADGIWSATRRALDPAAPEPVYAGIYSVSGVSAARGDWRPGFNWTFAKRGVFIHITAPDGTLWWSAQVASPEPPADLAAGLSGAALAELFATEPVPSAVLEEATVSAATLLHVLRPVSRRQDGRRVLIGDAAHPAGAGQGASMALEDAVELAAHLADGPAADAAGPAIGVALARFDEVRHARAGKLARMEAKNRDAKTAGPIAGRLREVMMPFFFTRFYENATGWLYDYDSGPR